jgi:hypothetical protein
MEGRTRTLEITLEITSENTFLMDVYEPESGDQFAYHLHDDDTNLESENSIIANEIRSWVSMLREEMEDEKKMEEDE